MAFNQFGANIAHARNSYTSLDYRSKEMPVFGPVVKSAPVADSVPLMTMPEIHQAFRVSHVERANTESLVEKFFGFNLDF